MSSRLDGGVAEWADWATGGSKFKREFGKIECSISTQGHSEDIGPDWRIVNRRRRLTFRLFIHVIAKLKSETRG